MNAPIQESDLRGARCLLVASTGGHLAQLSRFAEQWDVAPQSLWLTFDSPQSRSLLNGRRVEFVPYVRPRDWRGILRAARVSRQLLASESFEYVISTGAGLALAALPQAAARGVPTLYVESVSRLTGPSVTGRVLARVPRVDTRTQHRAWSGPRWPLVDSVLSTYQAEKVREPVTSPRLFVTLGTIAGYRFDAMVDTLLESAAPDDRTVWQLGETLRETLPGTSRAQFASDEFDALALDADVVVTHAGVGTIVRLLELGIFPVVVPRRRERREHVDDHQLQICDLLTREGLGIVVDAKDLTAQHLHEASSFRVNAAGALR